MVARVLAIIGMVGVALMSFILMTSNPFNRILPDFPLDGADLNPLLQDIGLIIHPPILYMGYVGFTVPFAFAMAALLGGRLDSAWARWSRPGMDERLRPLWLWHAIEESEHKSVAFDVYQQQVGNYWIRVSEMAFTSVFFTFFTGLHTVQLLRATEEQRNFKAIAQGLNVLVGRKGFFRGMMPQYLAYYRPDFHPTQRDSSLLRAKGLRLLQGFLG